jgi:hypothetical protein
MLKEFLSFNLSWLGPKGKDALVQIVLMKLIRRETIILRL